MDDEAEEELDLDIHDPSFGDWRVRMVTYLTRDYISQGNVVPRGTPVYQVTITKDLEDKTVSFITPSIPAISISVAIDAAIASEELRKNINYRKVRETTWEIEKDNLSYLYDFFEKSIIATIFSYVALESFCNLRIADLMEEGMLFALERNGVLKEYNSDEIQKFVSTDEKLSTVLPSLLNVKSPKGTKIWENYNKLKKVRDATVHFKATDQYPHGKGKKNIDKESVLYYLFNNRAKTYPITAIDMMDYFEGGKASYRWMKKALEFVAQNKVVTPPPNQPKRNKKKAK